MAPSLKLTGVLKEGLVLLGFMVLVAVALPLLAAAVFSTRFLFVGVLVAGAVVLLASPAFRRYLVPADAKARGLAGLGLPAAVHLGPHHSWARAAAGGRLTVGVDDLLQKVFGPVEAVELPAVGTRVRAGDALLTLRRGGRVLEVRAPVAGTVRAVNEALAADAALLNRAPYGRGWAVELEAPKQELGTLKAGKAAVAWLRGELDRLVAAVAAPSPVPVTLQDGGPLAPEFFRALDDETFARLARELFGQR